MFPSVAMMSSVEEHLRLIRICTESEELLREENLCLLKTRLFTMSSFVRICVVSCPGSRSLPRK